jgi:hypothetical protein
MWIRRNIISISGIFGFLTIGILLWPMYFIKTGEVFGLGPSYRYHTLYYS